VVVHSSTEPIGRRRCHRQWDAYSNFVNLEDLSVQSPKTLIWVWCLRCTSESQTKKKRKKEKSTTLKFQPFHHGCCSSNTGRRSRLWSWKKKVPDPGFSSSSQRRTSLPPASRHQRDRFQCPAAVELDAHILTSTSDNDALACKWERAFPVPTTLFREDWSVCLDARLYFLQQWFKSLTGIRKKAAPQMLTTR